jgi:Ca2+-transporting ATPase
MANASVICADKIGTLTRNKMTAVAGSIGIHTKFVQRVDEKLRTHQGGNEDTSLDTGHPNVRDFAVDLLNLNTTLTPESIHPKPLQSSESFR